jgi:hypothetical protein
VSRAGGPCGIIIIIKSMRAAFPLVLADTSKQPVRAHLKPLVGLLHGVLRPTINARPGAAAALSTQDGQQALQGRHSHAGWVCSKQRLLLLLGDLAVQLLPLLLPPPCLGPAAAAAAAPAWLQKLHICELYPQLLQPQPQQHCWC